MGRQLGFHLQQPFHKFEVQRQTSTLESLFVISPTWNRKFIRSKSCCDRSKFNFFQVRRNWCPRFRFFCVGIAEDCIMTRNELPNEIHQILVTLYFMLRCNR